MALSIMQHELQSYKSKIELLQSKHIREWIEYYFGLNMGLVHEIWFKHYLLNEKCPKWLCEAPMGHAKSTYVGILYPIHLICQFNMGILPKCQILLGGSTLERSLDLMRHITYHMENNDKLIADYGPFKPSIPMKWTEKVIYVARAERADHPTLRVTAVDAATAGKRATHIIGDDLVDNKNSRTEMGRLKVKEWFNMMFLSRLEPGGIARWINTEYGELTLTQDIINKKDNLYHDWECSIYRAIDEKENPGPKGELWPEYYNYEALMEKKKGMTIIEWELCYQNNPVALKGAVFKLENLMYYKTPPKDLRIFQGVDLSTGEGQDYFVILTLGIDAQEFIYILDIYRAKIRFSEQVKAIVTKAAVHHPMGIGIETNQYQKALPQHLNSISTLPIHDINTTKGKDERMLRLAYYFENKKIYIQENMHDFINEYLSYNLSVKGKSPDQLDALDLALDTALGQGIKEFFGGGERHYRAKWKF